MATATGQPITKHGSGAFSNLWSSIKQRYSARYITRRIIGTILVYITTLIIIFIIPHLMPGNIAYQFVSRLLAINPTISPAKALSIVEAEYGLNHPLYVQFEIYLKNVLLTFPPNFGNSFEFISTPAMRIVMRALPFTLLLIVISQVIAWGSSIYLGVKLALRKNHLSDKVAVPSLYMLYSIPIFWLALIFILIFTIDLHLISSSISVSAGAPFGKVMYALAFPIAIVVVSTVPNHVLIIRSATVDFLKSDFVMALKAQGLKSSTFTLKLMKNALLPSITQFFMQFGYLIGGIYVIESLFSLPGMGTVIITAAIEYDYPVLEAGLFVTSVVMIVSNLIADLLYPLLDPRVSYM
ncbi:MAG: ABC transporter permease [Candidatus Thermoplasmatota archaeon]|nr:ABC transporter permease [Candidatus Thermoplasmatota archaeon]